MSHKKGKPPAAIGPRTFYAAVLIGVAINFARIGVHLHQYVELTPPAQVRTAYAATTRVTTKIRNRTSIPADQWRGVDKMCSSDCVPLRSQYSTQSPSISVVSQAGSGRPESTLKGFFKTWCSRAKSIKSALTSSTSISA